MEKAQFLTLILFFLASCCAISVICILLTRWMQRVEKKINDIKKSIHVSTRRLDSVYVNQLLSLQQTYVATEQYEWAAQVHKLIELELKLQKERDEKSVQD